MIPTVEYILADRRTTLCIDNLEPEKVRVGAEIESIKFNLLFIFGDIA